MKCSRCNKYDNPEDAFYCEKCMARLRAAPMDLSYPLQPQAIMAPTGDIKKIVLKEPLCIIDSHMHVVSGRCTPLPLIWARVPGGLKRETIELLSSDSTPKTAPILYAQLIYKFLNYLGPRLGLFSLSGDRTGNIQINSCDEIARIAVIMNWQALDPDSNKEFEEYKHYGLCSLLMIMPMDMEFAHYGGYNGEKIYQSDSQGLYYYKYDSSGQRLKEYLPEKDKDYLKWEGQLAETKRALLEYPWKLLSMYHYEPRRWKENWSGPFEEIATKDNPGLFIGFKMYPPLGYKPLDDNLPNLPQYYNQCSQKGIPILTHCSAGGLITYEWRQYLEKEKNLKIKSSYKSLQDFYYDLRIYAHYEWRGDKFQTAAPLEKKRVIEKHKEAIKFIGAKEGLMGRELETIFDYAYKRCRTDARYYDAQREYFIDEFIHPCAWRKVLKLYPKLKLCLAHFGGEFWIPEQKYAIGEPWIREIVDLIEDYDNVFTDISYFDYEKGYQTEFKKFLVKIIEEKRTKILERILFGTDWYMTEFGNLHYKEYCAYVKSFLDEIHPSLWLRFAIVNPFEFYRLDEIAENYRKGLIQEAKKMVLPTDLLNKIEQRAKTGAENISLLKEQIENLKHNITWENG